MDFDLEKGYKKALSLAKTHYENFPVVSFLLPEEIKKHIAVFYWFARTADDIADEGNLTSEQRLTKLDEFRFRFESLMTGDFKNDFEYCLANTINQKKLTTQYFLDLLTAFRQDVIKVRYKDFEEVLNYCKHSANPVGRLLLELFGYKDIRLNLLSDKICTALQLTNFLQDVLIDFQKGRIYLCENEMVDFGVNEKMFELKEINHNLKHLIEFNVNRTELLFQDGRELLKRLTGGLKIEIAWTINGGELILKKIRKNNFDVLINRPSLTKSDFIKIFFKGLFS